MDILKQILGWLVAIGAVTIIGYILHVRGRNPRLVRLCRFAFFGVSFGFVAGLVAHSYSGDFTGWITRQSFVPFRFQEFVVAHDSYAAYAPIFGMVSGLGLAVSVWYFRSHKYAV